MPTNSQSSAEPVSNFTALSKINVNQHTEKKGRFTYLSWTFAVSEAMKADPLTVWVFREPMFFKDGTMMVHCDVTMFGKSIYMFLPVMNNSNKAISNPNAFDVNSAMMRCLVKGIAAHGLGLYIYAGEDLPEEEKQAQSSQQQSNQVGQAPSQPQQTPKDNRTQEQLYNDALSAIKNAPDTNILKIAVKKFKGTVYEVGITNACRARADQMGWPTKQNTNSNQQAMHH
ncbi:DUF1071 domain-containing protein [Acinetobacter chinensis]|uniref:DUF1071 domain-containing protein n=1 Tax=Acinetobacter chinensis TaxID=2004650 RepID=A0ABU3WFA5_9GAMM|nr:DUF1071 domain-containing protein [Acinetobacter chinensis]MDV2468866.1 DUF1071 domain-containing protein [Acinetobacter chinensis]